MIVQNRQFRSPVRNPMTRFAVRREESDWQTIHLAIPVRGRPLLRTVVERAETPRLFESVRRVITTSNIDGDLCINDLFTEVELAELVRLGLVIDASAISRPTAFFPCLDELTADLSMVEDPPSNWILASDMYYQPSGTPLPEAIASRIVLEGKGRWGGPEAWFVPGCARLWITDPGTQILMAFGVPTEEQGLMEALSPGEPPPGNLSPQARKVLRRAGVLVPPDFRVKRTVEWQTRCQQAHAQFTTNSFANLEGLVHPIQLSALRSYLYDLMAEGFIALDVMKGYGEHNESLCRYFHYQLTSLVSRIVGRLVKPSYSYFRSYVAGESVAKHIDRAPSHYSISFLVDFTPASEHRSTWPLWFELSALGTVPLFQKIGDGVFFEGMKTPHFRERLSEGCTSTSIFFEYAPEEYAGALG